MTSDVGTGAPVLAGLPSDVLWAEGLPPGTAGVMTGRLGGVSGGPFRSLNLRPAGLPGDAVDDAASIAENQRRLRSWIGARPVWLNQVHGAAVVRIGADTPEYSLPIADASLTTEPGVACAVLVADCLPVLFAAPGARGVAAAHAGWRGLAGGVLENTVAALCEATACRPGDLVAWLGACIGPTAFEVGADVVDAFAGTAGQPIGAGSTARFAFAPRSDGSPRWKADLAGLARDRLAAVGVGPVSGGGWCTVADASRFFSYRRDGVTGRMAACIWIDRARAG